MRRLQRQEIQQRLRRLETPGLVIGEFTLDDHAVVDGDTIRVAGLRTTLRLLAIDTEETFKSLAEPLAEVEFSLAFFRTHWRAPPLD